MIAAAKLQLRPQDRIALGSPAVARHIDQLAAMRLNDAPGVNTVLEGMVWVRQEHASKLGCSPGTFPPRFGGPRVDF